MFNEHNCYIYLEAKAGISQREDFWIIDIPEHFRISATLFGSVQNISNSKSVMVPF